MIKSIRIINFRSIKNLCFTFNEKTNNIVGKNGAGKTNVLQAISYLFGENTFNLKSENIINFGENDLFLEGIFEDRNGIEQKISFSYSKEQNKKQYLLNGKKATKKILDENILKVCSFYPVTMNLFYLGPKYRREFLDNILKNCYSEYKKLLKDYENVLKSRNKILKNINIGESKIEEIKFWDEKFIILSQKIYEYRIILINFIKKRIQKNEIFFKEKNIIEFKYISKVKANSIGEDIKNYLEKNIQRDIILGKTQIGPHVDDFDILINNISIVDYASRGEQKSIIMNLKNFEIEFTKEITGKTPILLIDDLSSELDENHIKLFMEQNIFFQTFITSILPITKEENTIISI